MAKRKPTKHDRPPQPSGAARGKPRDGGAKNSGAKGGAAKRSGPKRGKPKRGSAEAGAPRSEIRLRQLPSEQAWEIVLPRCARDRKEDIEEVRQMLEAGEFDVARDECLWLLQGCSDCMEAHYLLGEIALGDNDFPLARGHFGYAFQLGNKAIQRTRGASPVPYRLAANKIFHESGKALVYCLLQLGKPEMAKEVIDALLWADPDDPLAVRELATGGGSCGAAEPD